MRPILTLLVALALAQPLSAQFTVPGAGDQSIPIVRGTTSLNFDFAKAKLGFTFNSNSLDPAPAIPRFPAGCGGLTGHILLDCLHAKWTVVGQRDRTEFGGRIALAAVDGKRDLFSGGRVSPGLEGGLTLRRVFNRRGSECRNVVTRFTREGGRYVEDEDGDYVLAYTEDELDPTPTDTIPLTDKRFRRDWTLNVYVEDTSGLWIRSGGKYRRLAADRVCGRLSEWAVSATGTGSWKQVKVAEFLDPAETVVVPRDDRSEKVIGGVVGVERWFSQSNKLGLFAQGEHHWSGPGPAKPVEVCTQTFAAADTLGNPVTGAKCDDRITDDLVDYFAFRPHVNWLYRFASDEGPSWGLVAGVSSTITEPFKPTYDAIAGVTLHPDGKPNDVLAAFVVTFKDFTNGNDKDLEFFKDQFSVRLYVAIDLKLGP